MNILFAASEVAPFAKTGGLADVAGSLPSALASLGHDVRVVLPRYRQVDPAQFSLKHRATFHLPISTWYERCDILEGSTADGITVYFVNKDSYYDRPGIYGTSRGDYPDNAERFAFFSRSLFELCRVLDFSPDIIHCNDWQTGLVPYYLKTQYAAQAPFDRTKTVFTVHNLGYQGRFPPETMHRLGLGPEALSPKGIEFGGAFSFLTAGLAYADAITTVSKRYSEEIQQSEYACGLEGLLAHRAGSLFGILNGIDYRAWDPAKDGAIARRYDVLEPAGKAACKEALQKLAGFSPDTAPLIGMVTRLTGQKGLDLLVDAVPAIMALGVRLIILGTGEEQYHRILTDLHGRYPDQIQVIFRFDESIARAIYAGSDLFLMPSRYEPCGLSQIIALRYGAVPIVRKTGGLADTVHDYDHHAGKGTGFVFDEYSSGALVAAVKRALAIKSDQKKWNNLMLQCMSKDFSWKNSAREYDRLYHNIAMPSQGGRRETSMAGKNNGGDRRVS